MAGNTATRTYTIKLRFPHIGDYISYKPDIPSAEYYLSSTQSGYSSNQIIDTSYDPTEWKILEVNENKNITKILGVPSNSQKTVFFQGPIGYNNGVYLLNDICKKRYGNANLGTSANNLTLEDVESNMTETGISARNSQSRGTSKYGTTRRYTGSYTRYPAVYGQEKYSGINISDVANGSQIILGNVDITAHKKMNPNGKHKSDNIYSSLPSTSETTGSYVANLTCTQTYYGFDSQDQSFSSYFDSNFYNMIWGTGTYFWLATRYVDCDSNYADSYFGLCYVENNGLRGDNMYDSSGDIYVSGLRLAPTVSFGDEIKVQSGSGTKSDPYIIEK